MDEFVSFEFLLLDASGAPAHPVTVVERGPRRERVDLIARQFRDFLLGGDPADLSPRGLVLTPEFKLRRQAGPTAGWLTFLVDRGTVAAEALEEVALVVYARADDAEGRQALRQLEPYIHLPELPRAPLAVAVKRVPRVPSMISEWYGKSVAGFFGAKS